MKTDQGEQGFSVSFGSDAGTTNIHMQLQGRPEFWGEVQPPASRPRYSFSPSSLRPLETAMSECRAGISGRDPTSPAPGRLLQLGRFRSGVGRLLRRPAGCRFRTGFRLGTISAACLTSICWTDASEAHTRSLDQGICHGRQRYSRPESQRGAEAKPTVDGQPLASMARVDRNYSKHNEWM